MATQTPITQAQIMQMSSQIGASAIFLLYYDWIVMLPTEISEIWHKKNSVITFLYFVVRYVNLAAWVLFPIFGLSAGDELCQILGWLSSSLQLVGVQSIRVIFILRVWALFERSPVIFVVLCIAWLGPFLGNIGLFWEQTPAYIVPDPSGVGGCTLAPKPSLHIWNSIDTFGTLAFDSLVFSLTLFKTLKGSWDARSLNLRGSLYIHLLRNGAIYFLIVTLLNIGDAVIFSVVSENSPFFSTVNSFVAILQPVLTCRLVLNLRRLSHSSLTPRSMGTQATTNPSTLPDVQFARSRVTYPALMEMGAPIRIDGEDDELDLDHQDMALSEIQKENQGVLPEGGNRSSLDA